MAVELKPSVQSEQARFAMHASLMVERYTPKLEVPSVAAIHWVHDDKDRGEALVVNKRLVMAAHLVATGKLNEGV